MPYSDDEASDRGPRESLASTILTVFVRLVGVGLALAGVAVAVLVLLEAWALYKYPERIEAFAQAVERGSNIDKALAPRGRSPAAAPAEAPYETEDGELIPGESAAPPGASAAPADEAVRLSYFFAWFIVFILIALITRIAIAAVSTGARLALYDTETRRLARALVGEVRRTGPG